MNTGAVISNDNNYRYQLWRIWDENERKIAFVGLNPSTADHQIDDPTIRRCIEYAKSWGYGGFYMVNLFAYRTTDPKLLSNQSDPIGPDNDMHLADVFSKVDKVICAWGNGGGLNNRGKEVLTVIQDPYYLQMNGSGEPAHPLYLKKSLTPIPLSSLANLQSKFKDDIFEVNPFVTSSDPIKKSKHVFISHSPERDSIYSHRLKHFNSNEELVASIKVTDNAIYFQEDDEIIIGTHAIYWYMSRVGQYYSKSNGEFDAEHQSEEHILIASETATWKTVCEQEICYLELQQKNGHFFRSTGIKLSEVEALIALQKQLNTLNSETS